MWILLLLPSCKFLRERGFFGNKARKEAILWARQDSIRISDSLKKIGIVSNNGEAMDYDSLRPQSNGKIKVPARGTWHIISGSYSRSGNAELAAVQYRNKGYNTSIIKTTSRNGEKVNLVSVKNFNNVDEADRFLKEFQEKIDPKAWKYQNQ
jgi:hypothetical protein